MKKRKERDIKGNGKDWNKDEKHHVFCVECNRLLGACSAHFALSFRVLFEQFAAIYENSWRTASQPHNFKNKLTTCNSMSYTNTENDLDHE